jgi:hypothetical protein
MLCASGFEFEEKMRLARVEQENAQRLLQFTSASRQDSSKRVEDAAERYKRRMSDFVRHKRVCTLCKES